jgi:uncharacterized protein (TIGR02757 family)
VNGRKINEIDLKEFLEEKADYYNRPWFIESDPVCVPHLFSLKQDIEISGFLTATIAWGNRKMIIRNALRLMDLLDHSPFEFIKGYKDDDLSRFDDFVHRTFNGADLKYFIKALRNVYTEHGDLEKLFAGYAASGSLQPAISMFRRDFFSVAPPGRTAKHISDPERGSVAKRINLFLRWVVRQDDRGVDFGIWKSVSPSMLSCPLDLHSGNVARKLGLISRKQNDTRALAELDSNLRMMDPDDPVKYDYALFGLGIFEKF